MSPIWLEPRERGFARQYTLGGSGRRSRAAYEPTPRALWVTATVTA